MKPHEFLDHLNEAQPEYIADAAPKKKQIRTEAPEQFADDSDTPAKPVSGSSRALMWSARAAVVLLAVGIGALGLHAYRMNVPIGLQVDFAGESTLSENVPGDSSSDIAVQTAPPESLTAVQYVLDYLGISTDDLTIEPSVMKDNSSTWWVYTSTAPELPLIAVNHPNGSKLSFYTAVSDPNTASSLATIICSDLNDQNTALRPGSGTLSKTELNARAAKIMAYLLPDYSSYEDVTAETPNSPSTLILRRTVPGTMLIQEASIWLFPNGGIQLVSLPIPYTRERWLSEEFFTEEQDLLFDAIRKEAETLYPGSAFSIETDGTAEYACVNDICMKQIGITLTLDGASYQAELALKPRDQIDESKIRDMLETVIQQAPPAEPQTTLVTEKADILAYLGISENELIRDDSTVLTAISMISAWLYSEPRPSNRIEQYHTQSGIHLTFFAEETMQQKLCYINYDYDSGGLFAENRTLTEEELKARAEEIMRHLLPDYSSYREMADTGIAFEGQHALRLERTIPDTPYTLNTYIVLTPDGGLKELMLPTPDVPTEYDAGTFDQEQRLVLDTYANRFRELHPGHEFSISAGDQANYSFFRGSAIKTVKCSLAMDGKTMQISFSIMPGAQIDTEKLDAEIEEQWTVFSTMTDSN